MRSKRRSNYLGGPVLNSTTEGQLVSPIEASRGGVATAHAFNQAAGIPTGDTRERLHRPRDGYSREDLMSAHRLYSVRLQLVHLSH
jgi:hypothetical protein